MLLVLLHHFARHIGDRFATGYFGVELFFVLSGFLITRILYQSQGSLGAVYRQFTGRRALRIFPVYYLLLVVLLLAGEPSARQYWLPLFTYTFNYTIAARQLSGIPFIHTWSLCVEEQFYLLWPLLVLSLRSRWHWLMAALTFIVLAGWAQMLFQIIPMRPGFTSMGLFPRAYALALGGWVALLCLRYPQPGRWLHSVWVELGSLLLLAGVLYQHQPIMFVIAPSVVGFWLAKIYYQQIRLGAIHRLLQHRIATYLGRISYGIYLYHIPVALYFSRHVFTPLWGRIPFKTMGRWAALQHYQWVLQLLLFSLLAIGTAHLSYRFIEQPLLRWKDRWFPHGGKGEA